MNLNATILGQTIAFILFVLFCMKYIWPPLINIIETRQKEIADSLAATERAKKDLLLAKAEAMNYLKQATLKAQTIIEEANKHKIQLMNASKAEAETQRHKILKQAQKEIYSEYIRVREDLRKQVAVLAVASAEKIIEHSLDENIHKDIINNFISKL